MKRLLLSSLFVCALAAAPAYAALQAGAKAPDFQAQASLGGKEFTFKLKDALKKKEVSEDEERRTQDDIQKLTDRFVAEVDKLLADKEKDLMAV